MVTPSSHSAHVIGMSLRHSQSHGAWYATGVQSRLRVVAGLQKSACARWLGLALGLGLGLGFT